MCIVIVILFCNGTIAPGASASSGFSFGGTSTLTGQYSSHQPFGHQIPTEYLTWQLRSRLTLFHIPLNVSSVLSTQQQGSAQSINHVSVGLDTRLLARHISDTGRLRFLGLFETFELGRTRPQYSSLTLHGIPVTGANVALRAGVFHTAFVYGISKRPVRRGMYLQQQHRQRMMYGRVGVGYDDRTFVRFSVLHSREEAESIDPAGRYYHWPADTLVHHLDTLFIPADSAAVFRKPGETLIPSLEMGTNLFDRRLTIQGELAGMANTANTESDPVTTDRAPDLVDRLHPIRLSTSVSYAYTISSDLRLGSTRLHASYRHIEPGYHSPGTPFMRHDLQQIQLRASQALFNRRLTLQPHYRRMNNNLMDQHRATTYTTVWGVTTTWRQPQLPWVSVSFSPHRQEIDDDVSPALNKARVVSASTGMNYTVRQELQAVTSFAYSNQHTSVSNAAGDRRFQGHNFSMQQSLRLTIPLHLTASGGVYFLDEEESSSTSYQVMLRGNYQVSEQWMVSAGGRHFNQGGDRKRWSARLETSYDFGPYGKIQLLAEPIYYRDVLRPEREYDQYVVRLQFVNTW